MPSLGEAYIEVHADTGPFDRELAASIEKSLIAAEATMRSRGRDAGNAFGEGVETAVDDHIKRVGDNMSDGLVDAARNAGRRAASEMSDALNDGFDLNFSANIEIPIPDLNQRDLDDRERELVNWSRRVGSAVSSAFQTAGGSLAFFIQGISQLTRITALLNPAVLTTTFGILGGLVLGLIGILNPLAALVATLPAVLAGLGAQALILGAAFSGITNSIGKIFGADSLAKSLEVAERFSGGVGNFLEGLAYFAQLWRDIVVIVQGSFFLPFQDSLKMLAKMLGEPAILAGVRNLAYSMGQFADALIKTFGSKAFKSLMEELFPTMSRIVEKLTGPFLILLEGLFNLIKGTLPFMEDLATLLGDLFTRFGNWLTEISKDGSLDTFLDDMYLTLQAIGMIIGNAFALIGTFLKTLKESGVGESFLLTIADVLFHLNQFFQSPIGQDAIVSMTQAAMGAIVVIGALIVAVTTLWQWMIYAFDAIGWAATKMKDGLKWVFERIADFFIWLGGGVAEQSLKIKNAVTSVGAFFISTWNTVKTNVAMAVGNILSTIASIPRNIKSFFSGLPDMLFGAGYRLITGLIDGIKAAVPGLQSTLQWITGMIPNFKGPEEVDKNLLVNSGYQVMEGFRRGIAIGAEGVFADLQGLTGMIGVNANANSFAFAPGSIVQNFNGAQPTVATAQTMGQATGNSIASTVNSQNARAAVRAI